MADPTASPPTYHDEKDSGSLEKGSTLDREPVIQADPRYKLDARDLDRVQRKLGQRHVQMIAVSISSLSMLCYSTLTVGTR
jgi:amino acid permease